MSALERWAEGLAAWAIPERILTAAPESPWGFPAELFRVRAARAVEAAPTTSGRRAREALPGGGAVLDVGVGGGAASLPLAPPASMITGVDTSQDMLEAFREGARQRGVAAVAIVGAWPDVERKAPFVDVVVCHHVLYNVPDLAPFVRALAAHAARRVVLEITLTHPLAWMNGLWRRFHDLERPEGPTAEDAHQALLELGFGARRTDEERSPLSSGLQRPEDAVALVRRRLCLPPDRDTEIAEALGPLLIERDGSWSAGPVEQTLSTLWWDTA